MRPDRLGLTSRVAHGTAPDIVDESLPDSEFHGLTALLPRGLRPFILLARFDRPIGIWLLFWPGAWAVALAGEGVARWDLLLWLLLGAAAMRGAGCVYNDIIDRDIDARVARTRMRPLASGAVSPRAAWVWLVVLALVGLVVLVQLHIAAALVALASLAPVAAYPFMKRFFGWPQAWLGLVFAWAALVGWTEAAGRIDWPGVALYLGGLAWVIGYDTIYALQDREDDALIGIRSSARTLGRHVRLGVAFCYLLTLGVCGLAIWIVRPDPLALAALAPVGLHLGWQVATLDPRDGENALARFRSNRGAGFLMFLACLAVGSA